jgi:hypothetical protein
MTLEYRNSKPKKVQTFIRQDDNGRSMKATARCLDDRTNSWELEVSIPSGEKWQRTEYGSEVNIGVKLAVMAAQYDDQFRRNGDRPRDAMMPDRSRGVVDAPITHTPPHLTYRR